MSLLYNAWRHPLCTLYYESILRTNSMCSDWPLNSGSDLTVSSLLAMHRVIRKLWMDRPTFRQPAGEQCSLNTPLCCQSAGKQHQRGCSTWGRGFHILPPLSQSLLGVLTHSRSVSPSNYCPLLKTFHGKCAEAVSMFVLVCVYMYVHM